MRVPTRRLSLLAAVVALFAACAGETSTGPVSTSAPVAGAPAEGNLLGTLTSTLGLTQVGVLQRTTPLAADITVSQTIGSAGGTLSIPAAGVTVKVPSGALAGPTLITMTARKGSAVAYDFAPHGITFARPLVFTQKLTGTNATLLGSTALKLGYYSDAALLGTTTALVSELLGGVVNLLGWNFTAQIKHFSGYVVTCGRSGVL